MKNAIESLDAIADACRRMADSAEAAKKAAKAEDRETAHAFANACDAWAEEAKRAASEALEALR